MKNTRKKRKKRLRVDTLSLLIAVLFILAALLFSVIYAVITSVVTPSVPVQPTPSAEVTVVPTPEPISTPEVTATPESTYDPETDVRFTDPNSLLFCANKKHRLPDGFEPKNLRYVNVAQRYNESYLREEAASALEQMFADAQAQGMTLILGSAYRSYDLQAQLYNSYVIQQGTEYADSISSRPNYSDHETGLAVDIGCNDDSVYLEKAFANTAEGQWLYHNAHNYGFILRYPEGKQDITGYDFEPWHYRYIGVEYATEIYNADPDMTFEEYFGLVGGDYYD